MLSYVLRRLLETIPALIGAVVVAFFLLRLAPGGAAAAQTNERASAEARAKIEKKLGLDRPWWEQLAGCATLDFGVSFRHDRPARGFVLERFGNTMKLAFAAMFLAATLGTGAGALAAAKRGTWTDRSLMALTLLGVSLPVFWLGMIVLAVAGAAGWPWLSGSARGGYMILPAAVLAANSVAYIARMSRASMLETLGNDYLRTARAKGLSETRTVWRHGLRNALIPIITIAGLDFASYLTGAVLTESVFGYPGLGRALVEAIADRDQPVILCGVTLATFAFIAVNLLVDVLYGFADPRVRDARNGR
jgi:ABC-type dipeptide/oligopeptide/nickel transport system permease component